MDENMEKRCSYCKKIRRASYKINDIIWAMSVPASLVEKKLCLECFLYFADNRKVKLKRSDIEWLFFSGIVWVDK